MREKKEINNKYQKRSSSIKGTTSTSPKTLLGRRRMSHTSMTNALSGGIRGQGWTETSPSQEKNMWAGNLICHIIPYNRDDVTDIRNVAKYNPFLATTTSFILVELDRHFSRLPELLRSFFFFFLHSVNNIGGSLFGIICGYVLMEENFHEIFF
ncbi:hypothetical protein CEXT_8751 [Caerostris extrusa]|uniref:Rhomboid-like protein n=1 Tax=Caerostris extrusa TaxID=172846 RepID=A0AAV4PF90_CAEEX|nr:hypothetical protein CEXT_8751 [Caerostris extrusa]